MELAQATPGSSSLVAALQRADDEADASSIKALDGNRQFTLSTPNNGAFQALLDSNPNWTDLGDVPIDLVVLVLLWHVTFVRHNPASATSADQLPTFNGAPIPADGLVLNDGQANNMTEDLLNVQASNGIVHDTIGVLLPPA